MRATSLYESRAGGATTRGHMPGQARQRGIPPHGRPPSAIPAMSGDLVATLGDLVGVNVDKVIAPALSVLSVGVATFTQVQIAKVRQEGTDRMLGEVKDAILRLTTTTAALDGKVAALDGKVAALDGKVAALDGKVAALDGKVAALDGKLAAMVGEARLVDGRIVNFDGKATASDAKLTAIDSKFDRFRDHLDAKLDKMAESMARVDRSVAYLEAESKISSASAR